jgi:hypothetical protein
MKRRAGSNDGEVGRASRSNRKKASKPIDTLQIYKDGYKCCPHEDSYFSAFCAVFDYDKSIARVLYPGSYIHIVPSLVFESVTYVDAMKGKGNHVAKFFSDEARSDLKRNLISGYEYEPNAGSEITFYLEDFTKNNALKDEVSGSYDMLVSLSASGFIPDSCFKFVRPGGLLFVNDDFGDACLAKANPQRWDFVGAFENSEVDNSVCQLVTDPAYLKSKGYFSSKKKPHVEFTNEQLIQNKGMSFSKRIFKGKSRALAFLFRKIVY